MPEPMSEAWLAEIEKWAKTIAFVNPDAEEVQELATEIVPNLIAEIRRQREQMAAAVTERDLFLAQRLHTMVVSRGTPDLHGDELT